jgi:RNase adapter protein RapZ
VFVAEKFARMLREDGYAPSVNHRNLHSRPVDALEWQGNQARPLYND